MCGLGGYLDIKKTGKPIDETVLQVMQRSMVHRGPDGCGIWKSDTHGIGLAHRRLSIIDLSSAGQQPMLDKEKTVAICFNGEIYNHLALRKELEQCGYSYFSATDTETLLYAYKEWGITFLDKLEGMFAITLFDIWRNKLYLIRDRLGIKPLYFSWHNNILGFASEIKALWHLPGIKKQINPQGLYHAMTYMVAPAPMTLYKNVYKLPAGYYAKVDAQRNITFHEWYNPMQAIAGQPQLNDEHECIKLIQNQLKDSVEKRMMADVPVGVFLSGGVDSSLNVALMSEVSNKVKTFNVVFADFPENDERVWARKVSDYFSTEHQEILVTEKDAFDFFERMVYHQDEPIADCVCVPLYYVAKLAKDSGVTVVQVGEGSDEIFCGYSKYAYYLDSYHHYYRYTRFIPDFARRAVYTSFARAFPRQIERLARLKNWVEDKHLYWGGAVAFPEYLKESFFLPCVGVQQVDQIVAKIVPEFEQSFDSYSIVDYHLKKLKSYKHSASFLERIIYLDLKQRLSELLLMRIDKMAMATSIEGRVPFLDHKLVELALRIPQRLKYRNGMTKYILKKACEGILPHDVIYRRKIGFGAPIRGWYKSGTYFKEYFLQLLADHQKDLEPWIDTKQVQKLFDMHQQPGGEFSAQLWVMQNIIRAITM
jgi:asparagine synthase (glutamine-hydrolysing)